MVWPDIFIIVQKLLSGRLTRIWRFLVGLERARSQINNSTWKAVRRVNIYFCVHVRSYTCALRIILFIMNRRDYKIKSPLFVCQRRLTRWMLCTKMIKVKKYTQIILKTLIAQIKNIGIPLNIRPCIHTVYTNIHSIFTYFCGIITCCHIYWCRGLKVCYNVLNINQKQNT